MLSISALNYVFRIIKLDLGTARRFVELFDRCVVKICEAVYSVEFNINFAFRMLNFIKERSG